MAYPPRLDLGQVYPCPVCRQGTLEALPLMDAFSCRFCRHILAANLNQQQVQIVDSSQPLTWQWERERWHLVRGKAAGAMSLMVGVMACGLITLPAALVWLSGWVFPPLQPASSLSFSELWAILTLCVHGLLVAWLVGEYYQIPFYLIVKMRLLRSR